MDYPYTPQELQDFEDRRSGRARNGTVFLRSYDEGVMLTLGGKIKQDANGLDYYMVQVPHVEPPPGHWGVPINWSDGEDEWEDYVYPTFVISRDDVAPDLPRWHPGTMQYKVGATGTQNVTQQITQSVSKSGPLMREQMQQAVPYNLTYTIKCAAGRRGHATAKPNAGAADMLLLHVMRTYQPYCSVWVKDSLNDWRNYAAFQEAVSPIDEVVDMTNRTIGHTVTLRVEAELDLNDPETHRTVQRFIPRYQQHG